MQASEMIINIREITEDDIGGVSSTLDYADFIAAERGSDSSVGAPGKILAKIGNVKNLPAPAILYKYLLAHVRSASLYAQRLATHPLCRKCCPNGIVFSIVLLKGSDIVDPMRHNKQYPSLQQIKDAFSKNFPCKELRRK